MNKPLERLSLVSRHLTASNTNNFKMVSPITTHVLNTTTGMPGSSIPIKLSIKKGEDMDGSFIWEQVSAGEYFFRLTLHGCTIGYIILRIHCDIVHVK